MKPRLIPNISAFDARFHRLGWRGLIALVWFFVTLSLTPLMAFGCGDFSKAPHARWRTERIQGVQWLVTPCGERFFSVGVNVVDGGPPPGENQERVAYQWRRFAPNLAQWAAQTRARLRQWGFNTAGGWSLPPAVLRMPTIIELSLGSNSEFHWNDPFDPASGVRMASLARRLTAPYKGNALRVGYFLDNEVGWWNGPLFSHFIADAPERYTKQHLIVLLKEHYRDSWPAFVQDFVPPAGIGSFDELLPSRAKTQLRPGGQGIAFVRRWTARVAEQYYRSAAGALREADPGALIFSDRLPIFYDPDAVRVMAPYVDVIAVNYNLDAANGWVARYFFSSLDKLSGAKPVLISEWFFAAQENRTGNLNRTPYRADYLQGYLMTVQSQDQRARGAAAAARRLAAIPSLVGLHWFQFYDHPKGGRADGEDYNFGLVDVRDRPYEKLTAAFRQVNPSLPRLHQSARTPIPLPAVLPRAEVDPEDRSLLDWPLESVGVTLQAAPGEVAFGDLYAAWSSRGLNLATIAMDYYDPELLAFEGEFPRAEAFRIDLGVDAGAGARRFVLRVMPDLSGPRDSWMRFQVEWCERVGASCRAIPGGRAKYFCVEVDQPRIVVEALLPWQVLGLERAPQRRLRMSAAITAFYRSRWMSSSGGEPAELMANPKDWPLLQLQQTTGR